MASQKSAGWYVISLRPQGEHEPLRRAAARLGARTIALSPWRIRIRDDEQTRQALSRALAAERVLFTSPAAVEAAAHLTILRVRPRQTWLAVGAGTAAVLQRHGIEQVMFPERMDSEGLLALPALQSLAGSAIGFISAPDGRNLLAPALMERGAELLRADVYAREDVAMPTRQLETIRSLPASACVLITSAGALQRVLAGLPPDLRKRFIACVAVVASERLGELAREAGFRQVVRAAGPRNAQMLTAAADAVMHTNPLA